MFLFFSNKKCTGEFDDMVIAPVFGFDGFQDYYRKSQGGQFLKSVRVPLLAVQVTRVMLRFHWLIALTGW